MSKLILCVVTALVFLSPVSGQSPPPKVQTAADLKAEQELNRKTVSLLSELAQQVRGLKNKNNQIVARIGIAELIWKDQEAAARRLYQEALDSVRLAMDGIDQNDPESYIEYASLSRMRDRLLQSIGHHDPIWARDLLHKTRLTKSPNVASADAPPSEEPEAAEKTIDDNRLELSLATQMVERDPKEATRIARESLGKGISSELASFIPKLAEKDPKAAGDLAVEVINQLHHADFESNYDAVSLAVFMVGEAILSSLPANTEDSADKRPSLLDLQSSKEYIEFITDLASKQTPAGQALLMNLQSMFDGLESVAPDQAAQLTQRIAERQKSNPAATDGERIYDRFQTVSKENDTKAMLELAQSAPPEMREHLYGEAAARIWDEGDRDKATEIVRKNISDPLERNRLLEQFRAQAITDSLEKEDFVQAKVLISQTRSTGDRTRQLIQLAEVMTKKNDKKGALGVLDEAQSLLPGKARNSGELENQLKLADAYSEVDPNHGFALVTAAIDHINELIAASAVVANFSGMPSKLENDEFEIDSYTPASYGFSMLSKDTIRRLAVVDFERTKGMLERFQRPEIRIAALLKLSDGILGTPDEDCTCKTRAKTFGKKPANQ